ncbi:MAG TPA: hydroxymethylbilane synthase [Planctomycetaceae bacterium]|nr:hydroxymethylbilane synthase [Planctomycetaceae bacterium]
MPDSQTIRLATRKSPLALWQATWVAGELTRLGYKTQLVPLVSAGDNDLRPITSTSEVGLFTKRIQQALIEGEADVAVHSLKDLPTIEVPDLHLAAITQREVVEDRLVTAAGWTLDELPPSAVVGTSSRRRAAQLLHRRPDLQILPIRGNVQTRIDQVMRGDFDATLLAAAGLERLEMTDVAATTLSIEVMLPAPGQAALGIETRRDDEFTTEAISHLDHSETRAAVTAERAFLRELSGGCLAPIAALGTVDGQELRLRATVLTPDASIRLDVDVTGPVTEAYQLGIQAAHELRAQGADAIIAAAR